MGSPARPTSSVDERAGDFHAGYRRLRRYDLKLTSDTMPRSPVSDRSLSLN